MRTTLDNVWGQCRPAKQEVDSFILNGMNLQSCQIPLSLFYSSPHVYAKVWSPTHKINNIGIGDLCTRLTSIVLLVLLHVFLP